MGDSRLMSPRQDRSWPCWGSSGQEKLRPCTGAGSLVVLRGDGASYISPSTMARKNRVPGSTESGEHWRGLLASWHFLGLHQPLPHPLKDPRTTWETLGSGTQKTLLGGSAAGILGAGGS